MLFTRLGAERHWDSTWLSTASRKQGEESAEAWSSASLAGALGEQPSRAREGRQLVARGVSPWNPRELKYVLEPGKGATDSQGRQTHLEIGRAAIMALTGAPSGLRTFFFVAFSQGLTPLAND